MRKLPPFVLLFIALVTGLANAQTSAAKDAAAVPTIREKTAGMKHLEGLIPLDWDARTGKLYLEIPRMDAEGKSADFLYATSLPFGTGSNDLGLDRGQVSDGRIVHFERAGPNVLLCQPNLAFRTSSGDKDEQLAVRQSFAQSVLWGFTVAAESSDAAGDPAQFIGRLAP